LIWYHTWATEFSRVWVRVGYPQLTIYPRQLKNSGVQPTIYPTNDFLKHLILSYSFEIKQINERTNKYIKYYYFYTYLVLFLMNMIKLSVLKNRLSGTLSVGHPNISVVSGILSVVGIPPVPIPIPEKIQLLMFGWYII